MLINMIPYIVCKFLVLPYFKAITIEFQIFSHLFSFLFTSFLMVNVVFLTPLLLGSLSLKLGANNNDLGCKEM